LHAAAAKAQAARLIGLLVCITAGLRRRRERRDPARQQADEVSLQMQVHGADDRREAHWGRGGRQHHDLDACGCSLRLHHAMTGRCAAAGCWTVQRRRAAGQAAL
jgi:hypothetical protein